MENKNNSLIVLKDIVKEFKNGENKVRVLNNINLEINKGEFIAIIGSSGSGKSTLMNLLGCLDTPTSGQYIVNNKAAENLSKDELAELRREHFGFIFQRYHLINSISACENVEIPAVYSGISKDERRNRSYQLLLSLGLKGKEKQKPHQLSGGQQQRVSIARSLMNGGDVILADEPTGALDTTNGSQVMTLLKELHANGHTIIIVTHDANIAKQANRVIEISDGEIISDYQNITPNNNVHIKKNSDTSKRNNLFSFTHQLKEAFYMAYKAILSHKIRSFLTMLGIIIGIASVVSIVALGNGSKQQILSQINSLGTNTIDVYPGESWGDRKASQIKTLNERDIKLLKEQPYIDSVSANVSGNRSITYKSQEVTSQVIGVSENYFRVKAFDFSLGNSFQLKDIKSQTQVVVIDNNTKQKIFPHTNPIGEVIFIGKVPVRIIGVLKETSSSMGRSNENLQIFVPYTTAMHRILGVKNLSSITLRIKDGIDTQVAEQGIISLITRNHGGKKDFFTNNLDSVKQTVEQTTATLTLLISAIAIISLIVGGIGVMNIMLVSVTERTKEIGVRMAVGARQSDIMKQFLIEAVLVCLIGGALGIILSLLIGLLFNSLSVGFSMIYSNTSIITAVVCSSVIGVIFGFIPARNAAKLDPIVALVQE